VDLLRREIEILMVLQALVIEFSRIGRGRGRRRSISRMGVENYGSYLF